MEQIIKDKVKETRRESLFTRDLIQLKQTNYDGYWANLTNWEAVINTAISSQTGLVFALKDLNHLTVTLQDGRVCKIGPNILNVVINYMCNDTQQLIPVSKFKSGPLVPNTVSKLLRTVITSTVYDLRYDSGSKNGMLKDDHVISIQRLKETGLKIYEFYKYQYLVDEQYSDYVITTDHLFKLVQLSQEINEQDFHLILLYLSRDMGKITIKDDIVKFKAENSSPIDSNDINVSTLKATIYKLETMLDAIHVKQSKLKSQILSKDLSRVRIKYLLHNYKKTESHIAKQQVQLNNLTQLLDQINQQSFNKELIGILTNNSQLLQNLNASTDIDQLQDILDTMNSNIDESKQISEILKSDDIDDEELDKELDELVKGDKSEEASKSQGNDDLSDDLSKLKTGKAALGKTELGIDDGSATAANAGKTEGLNTGKTEAGKTEVGKTEAGKTEVGKTEAGKTEVGKTEAGKTEVGKTEAGKTEVGKTEAGKTEVGKTEAGKTEVGKTEVGKTEVGNTVSDKTKEKERKPLPA